MRWGIAGQDSSWKGGVRVFLESWYMRSWGCAVSWKQLQYFITAARPSIKSKDFSSLFQSLTATNATNDECGWRMSYWNYIQTQFSFSLCFSFPLLPLCQFLEFTTMLKKKNLYSQNNKFSLSLMSAFLSRLSQTESTLQTALEFLTGSQSVSNPNPCFSTSVFTLLFSPCSIFTFWQWNHYVCVGLQLKSCTGWLLASTLDDCIRVSLCIYCGID